MRADRDADPVSRLELRPFPALRFNPAIVPDLGEVTSPPYDVMDRAMIADLLDENPHNIVRLILPRLVSEPLEVDDPYDAAARRLTRWRDRGFLVSDDRPGLYVYEYGDAVDRVCGVIGALELHELDDRVVLPHEDVIPEIVADRLAMMESSQANLEPILLLYDGQGAASDTLAALRCTVPAIDVQAGDGTVHRVWQVTDEATVGSLREAIAPHQALIADGHHRYATYLQVRGHHRRAGDGPGPWDRGLALLIDSSEFPMRLGAIHRSIAEIDLASLSVPAGVDPGPARRLNTRRPAVPDRPRRLVLTDGRLVRTLDLPTSGAAEDATDTETLHERLLPAWGVTEDRVGYHHMVRQAVHRALQEAGVAVLLHPSSVAEVMAAARAGRILPRKSTSFGPKPRMGLVMRRFADEVGSVNRGLPT